jgi:uncharacterized protein (DUF1015 family)
MANLHPFRGYRFDPEKSGGLDQVVTQPYDKIPASLRRDYQKRSPYNVAHIICDSDYEAAGQRLKEWIAQGILARDDSPCLYVYRQTFRIEKEMVERTGFICLVSLEHAGQTVKGHEKVLDGPLQDRLQLLRATEVNDGLIFSLFSDPTKNSDRLLASASMEVPAVEVKDDLDVTHHIWPIRDKEVTARILQIIDPLTLYIADGHHRFETACTYARQCWGRGWRPSAVESFDKRMMALFNMEGSGLRILPTHRTVKGLTDFNQLAFLESLMSDFSVEKQSSLEDILSKLETETKRLGLVVDQPERFYLLSPLKEDLGSLKKLETPARGLDVNLLHVAILERFLGIGSKELATQSNVEYHRDPRMVIDRVRSGDCQMGFFLRPTKLSQVRACSEAGVKMPQKSTDFFPKLLTGLVFSRMEIDKESLG